MPITDRDTATPLSKARTDGGSGSRESVESLEVGGRRSPWWYTEDVLAELQEGQQVTLQGRGKRIAQVIDVLELTRRRFEGDVDIALEETVIDDPEGHKSDYLSALQANITVE